MSKINEIKERIASINKQKEELVAGLRNDFAPMFKELFDKSNGKIKSFGWAQYTPYFNDGDECVFSKNLDIDYGLYVNGVSIDECSEFGSSLYALAKFGTDGYDEWIEKYPEDKINESTKDLDLLLYGICTEFIEVMNSIDDEFLKDLFGDHVLVTIHTDGSVTTSEYYHD